MFCSLPFIVQKFNVMLLIVCLKQQENQTTRQYNVNNASYIANGKIYWANQKKRTSTIYVPNLMYQISITTGITYHRFIQI